MNLVVLPERKGFIETIMERREDGMEAMAGLPWTSAGSCAG